MNLKTHLYTTDYMFRASDSATTDLPQTKQYCSFINYITACTVVQAVVKATSQSNGKNQILTPWGSETPERISMKLGIYNRVAGMATHANPCGAATSWVVWANT